METQTTGRDVLNDFAPKFAELNDDVLFGQVWSREDELSLKVRSIVTITALISCSSALTAGSAIWRWNVRARTLQMSG